MKYLILLLLTGCIQSEAHVTCEDPFYKGKVSYINITENGIWFVAEGKTYHYSVSTKCEVVYQ